MLQADGYGFRDPLVLEKKAKSTRIKENRDKQAVSATEFFFLLARSSKLTKIKEAEDDTGWS